MSKIEKLRQKIEKLTPRERAELNALLQNWTEDDRDRHMAVDSVAGGKLDKLRQEAESEAKAGKLREFPKPGRLSDAAADFLAHEARSELETALPTCRSRPQHFPPASPPASPPVAEA